MFANINLNYIVALLMSTGKRSFAQLAQIFGFHESTMRRQIPPAKKSIECLKSIAEALFGKEDIICLVFDDSKLNKMHSKFMQGAAKFFFEKFGRRFMAFKIIVAAITSGKNIIPVDFEYMNAAEYTELDPALKKFDKAKYMKTVYDQVKILFPSSEIVIIADGLFGTVDVLKFTVSNNIKAVFRCAKNRKILYQNKKNALTEIADLERQKNQNSRTIQAVWHEMNLYFTSVQRVDKHKEISMIYLVSTFVDQNKPSLLSELYQKRWMIEKMFRTTKQSLGLGECFSRILEKQREHVAAVFLAYAILQMKQKQNDLASPEEAKRQLIGKKIATTKSRINALGRIFGECYA